MSKDGSPTPTIVSSLIGYGRSDLETGAVRWERLTPPAWIERTRQADEEFRSTGYITPFEKEFFRRDGTTFWGLFGGAKIDGLAEVISFIVDISGRKKLEEEIKHLAHHDVLTGLPNRRLLRDFLRMELFKARRDQKKLALLFLDLDRFKEINDTLGHEAGDELLKAVAGRLKSSIRESDIVAHRRDEFNILLADVARPDDITGLVQKVIDSLEEPFLIAGHVLHMTASIGISMYPDDSEETTRCSGTRTSPCTTLRSGAGTRSSSMITTSTSGPSKS
jgi:diguanylate cyclase (GGDEF)-like protein/PAS domain S-box-containing protein